MKIPTILAQTEVPGSLPSVGVGSQAVVSGYHELAANISRVGAAVDQFASIQQKQQAQQDRDSALDITSGAAQSAELVREQTKLPQGPDNPHGIPDGEAASQTYADRYLKGYDEMAKEIVRKAPNDQVKRYVDNALIRLRGETGKQAQVDQFALFKDEQIAGLPQRLETYRAQIIGNPGQRETLSMARDLYIDSMSTLLPSQRAKLKQEEKDKTNMGLAQREVDKQPFDPIGQYAAELTPENYLKLTYHQEARQRQAIAFQDKVDKEAKANMDERRKTIVDDADSKANRGELTIDYLEKMREARDITGEDYRRLANRVLNEKDVPDIPAVAERLILGSHSLNPTVTEQDVLRARGANQISLKTAQSILDRLRATNMALRDKGDTQISKDHAQAEQILRASLGIQYGVQGIVAEAMKNSPEGRLYYSGLDELTRRSAMYKDAYGGTENPLTVVDELGQRLNRALSTSNNNRLNEVRGTLRFQTPQELEKAKTSGVINQSAYMLELRKFSEIDKLGAPNVNLPKTGGGGENKSQQGGSGRLEYKPGG